MKTEGHERKEGKKSLWGRMKGEPNERGKPMTAQTSLRNLLQKPSLLVNTPRARKGGGEEEKRRRERRKQRCSQLRHKRPRTHQKGRAPSYDESIQGRPRKRVKRGKREGKKERERERRGEERKEGVPSYEQSSRDTPKKERGDPEYDIQENPRKQREKGGGQGEKGAKSSTGSNEPQKYFGRSDHVEALSQLGPLRSRMGMSQLRIPKMRQKSSDVRPRPPTLAASCSVSGQWIRSTYTRSTGPREALCGLIPGWHEVKHT